MTINYETLISTEFCATRDYEHVRRFAITYADYSIENWQDVERDPEIVKQMKDSDTDDFYEHSKVELDNVWTEVCLKKDMPVGDGLSCLGWTPGHYQNMCLYLCYGSTLVCNKSEKANLDGLMLSILGDMADACHDQPNQDSEDLYLVFVDQCAMWKFFQAAKSHRQAAIIESMKRISSVRFTNEYLDIVT